MATPTGEIVARPIIVCACGCLREFQHYAVDKYREQRLAKFQATRCEECVARLNEEQRRAAAALPKKGEAFRQLPPGTRVSMNRQVGGDAGRTGWPSPSPDSGWRPAARPPIRPGDSPDALAIPHRGFTGEGRVPPVCALHFVIFRPAPQRPIVPEGEPVGSDSSPPVNPICPHCSAALWRVWATRRREDRPDRFRKCKHCGYLTRTTQRVKHPPPR